MQLATRGSAAQPISAAVRTENTLLTSAFPWRLLLRRCEVCIAGAMGGPGMTRVRPARSAGSRASMPAMPDSKPPMFEQDVQTSAHRINRLNRPVSTHHYASTRMVALLLIAMLSFALDGTAAASPRERQRNSSGELSSIRASMGASMAAPLSAHPTRMRCCAAVHTAHAGKGAAVSISARPIHAATKSLRHAPKSTAVRAVPQRWMRRS
jgi:hypothetical protein